MTIERTVLLLACAGTLLSMSWAGPASAQWMWKDETGHTIASDQPPPVGTPDSRILKQPRPRAVASTPVAAAVADKDGATRSLADRDLDSKQRQKEAAETSKKADDEAVRARAMQDNCSAVRGNLAALQAGGRAARFNEKGEKVYIDDGERQSEIAKSQGQVAQFCK